MAVVQQQVSYPHKHTYNSGTYVRTFTMAIGIPVGVLNAGIILSAISMALVLNICKTTTR